MFELPQVVPESGQEREALIKRANHQFCSEFISSALQAFILVIEVNDTKAEPRLVEVSELSPIALHMLLRESSVLLWIYTKAEPRLVEVSKLSPIALSVLVHLTACILDCCPLCLSAMLHAILPTCPIACPCAPDCLHP
jgi:hypothetical protein